MTKLTYTEAKTVKMLYRSTEDLPQRDPNRWTYNRLQDTFNCSKDTIWKAITGQTHSGRF